MPRPLASPLPLGFLALFVGSLLVSALQLHWVAPTQRLVLALAAVRFAITGGYELTSAAGWQYASGVCGIVVAGLALYARRLSDER